MQLHFLQSPAWQSVQQALGKQVFRRSGEGWEYLAILESGGIGLKRLYCPYGPVATSEHALHTALESLKALAASQGVTYLRVQPTGSEFSHEKLLSEKLREIHYSQPAHTWCIDLTQTEEMLIAHMKQNNRSIYRNYQKKGLVYEQSRNPEDITRLTTLLHGVASQNQITIHPDEYFRVQAHTLFSREKATLHFIIFESQTIAAALTYDDTYATYYAHAAADHEHRKLNASTALLAEIIVQAKREGRQLCDLYGITTSQDPHHKWAGFTKFKKSFGGYEKTLSYTYELGLKQPQYQIYSLLKRLRSR